MKESGGKLWVFINWLADVLSMLGRRPEKGCEWKFHRPEPSESGDLKQAIRYLRVAATHLQTVRMYLWDALRRFGYEIKNLSSSFYLRLYWSFLAFLRWLVRIS